MPAPGREPIEVECAKAQALAAPHATHVPCLGGVTPTLLLQWWLAAGDRPLTLVNRQWCTGCAAGAPGFVADRALRQVQGWLHACGVAAAHQPGVRLLPTPASARPEHIQQPRPAAPQLSRRGFFRRVTTEVGHVPKVAALPAGPRAQLQRAPCALPARERQLDALRQLADRQHADLPPDVLPAVVVSDRCADHGLCARLCPTHALTQVEQGDAMALQFDATRCVACGHCAQACPEHAIELGTGGSPTPRTVRLSRTRTCVQCGAEFASDQEQRTCPRCRARARMARSIFGTGVADA